MYHLRTSRDNTFLMCRAGALAAPSFGLVGGLLGVEGSADDPHSCCGTTLVLTMRTTHRQGVGDLRTRAVARASQPPPAVVNALVVLLGIPHADMAVAVGRTRPTVTRWLSGARKPRGEDLERWHKVTEELFETVHDLAEAGLLDLASEGHQSAYEQLVTWLLETEPL